jgi:prenyltransferase beta subunit
MNCSTSHEVGLEVNADEITCNQPMYCEFALQTLSRNIMIYWILDCLFMDKYENKLTTKSYNCMVTVINNRNNAKKYG